MLLEQVVDLFCFFVNLDLSLSDLIYECVSLSVQILNHLDFIDVFSFENLNLYLQFLVFVTLDNQGL